MTILVTGGTGFIGSHTVIELQNAGYDVVVVDNLYNSKKVVLDRIETICGRRPKFYELDVQDREGMNRVFDENRIDAVIHFAGYKAVGESTRKPLEYYSNNLDTTLVLCDVMRKHGSWRDDESVRHDQGVPGADPDRPLEERSRVECHAAPLLQSDRSTRERTHR